VSAPRRLGFVAAHKLGGFDAERVSQREQHVEGRVEPAGFDPVQAPHPQSSRAGKLPLAHVALLAQPADPLPERDQRPVMLDQLCNYGVRGGDRIAMIEQHHQPGSPRIENGETGEVVDITDEGDVLIQFDTTHQWRTLAGDELAKLRLGYASHIHRAQGATVTRTLVVTGGWQTSKEPAYVQASRARQGTDWYVNRQDLGEHGQDTHRIKRLARDMSRSRTQTSSLAHRKLFDNKWDIDAIDRHGPDRYAPRRPGQLPRLIRAIHRATQPQHPSAHDDSAAQARQAARRRSADRAADSR